MKKSRFTETQIVSMLKEYEQGKKGVTFIFWGVRQFKQIIFPV